MKFKVDIVSDVVCPWCFVGKRRLEKAIAQLKDDEFEIDTLPFQLNPDLPDGEVLLRAYLGQKFGSIAQLEEMEERLEGIASTEGIAMDFSKITYVANTLKAHALIQSVKNLDQKMKLKEALLSAYFEKGLRIGNDEVLKSVAKEQNVDYDENFDAPEKVAQMRLSEQRLKEQGISAVPTFIINNRYLIQGAQPAETFVKAFEEIKAKESV